MLPCMETSISLHRIYILKVYYVGLISVLLIFSFSLFSTTTFVPLWAILNRRLWLPVCNTISTRLRRSNRILGVSLHDRPKETIEGNLSLLYIAIRKHPTPSLNDEDVAKLPLKIEKLDTDLTAPSSDPVFFEPMPISELQAHPLVDDEQSTFDQSIESNAQKSPTERDVWGATGTLCSV